ncbi:polyphosphate polymerase domain-containing protein [Ulvibacterium marinum]|uniref:polyphosphate polymerase domain-containing protein n=1 Tax=Ulvibacterium marinum TaxID=2419782 RepID=UPI002494D252|nr:polyphosphate polymerase domain-containing protein [Ulvibacterium marinum]
MEKAAVSSKTHTPNLRFERKFVYERGETQAIIENVSRNPFGFKEVFHLRKVNNIYFDDANFNFYKQNVEGVANRKKLRLRWYGDESSQIHDPTIEIKIKQGEVGDKVSHKLRGLSFNLQRQSPNEVHNGLIAATSNSFRIKQALSSLQPALLNTYERRYFLSFCGKYRITVDFNQEFYNPNYQVYQHSKTKIDDVILELKYALENDREAREVSQSIAPRLSKNSKYVRGINLLYHPEL